MSEPLTPRQKIAIELLAHGTSHKDAAEQLGCDAKTLQRWQQSPAFREALHTQTGIVATEIARHMQALQSKALDTLALLLEHGSERVRLQAALRVLADVSPPPAKDSALAQQIDLSAHQNTPEYTSELHEALSYASNVLKSLGMIEATGQEKVNAVCRAPHM